MSGVREYNFNFDPKAQPNPHPTTNTKGLDQELHLWNPDKKVVHESIHPDTLF